MVPSEYLMNQEKYAKHPEKGFDYRIVEYEKIHQIQDEDFAKLVDAIDPQPGQVILDGMDGYGSVSRRVLDRTKEQGFQPQIYTLDESPVQVDRAKENISEIPEDRIICADIRETNLPPGSFDTAVIKMGVHEVSKEEQPKIFSEMFRLLKPGGKFVIWELALDQENQQIFQDFIREKDRLSGFDQLVRNRYFPRHDELTQLFQEAGFENITDFHEMQYSPSTLARQDELVSKDRKKLAEAKGQLSIEDENRLRDLGLNKVHELNDFSNPSHSGSVICDISSVIPNLVDDALVGKTKRNLTKYDATVRANLKVFGKICIRLPMENDSFQGQSLPQVLTSDKN